MITGFNHTSFTVADMATSVRFWTEALGFEAASVSPRSGGWQQEVTGVMGAALCVAHLFGYGAHIELIQDLEGAGRVEPAEPSDRGASHICLEVEDIEGTWQRLLEAGATPQGRIAEVVGAAKTCRAGYLRDPNGIIIELVEFG